MPDSVSYSDIEEKFTGFLKAKRCRKTPERYAILKEIMSIDKHFDVDYLYGRLEKTPYRVSKTTVYNNLELLIECGILRKHLFSNHAEYERIDSKVQHVHLICKVCGKMKEVKDQELMHYLEIKKFSAFNSEYFALSVYGTCSSCARKKKRVSNKQDVKK